MNISTCQNYCHFFMYANQRNIITTRVEFRRIFWFWLAKCIIWNRLDVFSSIFLQYIFEFGDNFISFPWSLRQIGGDDWQSSRPFVPRVVCDWFITSMHRQLLSTNPLPSIASFITSMHRQLLSMNPLSPAFYDRRESVQNWTRLVTRFICDT